MSALGVMVVAALAADPATHAKPQRVAYLDAALEAVRRAKPELLTQGVDYIGAMERGGCASSSPRLKVECLMTAARKLCKQKDPGCPAVMDVVVTNALAEPQWISTERRYDIMREHRDWKEELGRELHRLRGKLAVDFRLRGGAYATASTMGERIDGYCVLAADKSSLPWQACAAALVWFISAESSGEAQRGPP